jgi:hypothetical protein
MASLVSLSPFFIAISLRGATEKDVDIYIRLTLKYFIKNECPQVTSGHLQTS